MKILIASFAVVFLITFLATPSMGAGWFWDGGNAIGFSAFAGLIYLTITSAKRVDVRAHLLLGYGVLFVAAAHVFWFLLGDAAAVEFVKVGAPDYMWLGIVSFLLLCVLMTIAVVPDRVRVHKNYAMFRYWHQVLAVAAIASATYHIVVSNFYLGRWYQGLLFVAVAGAAAFGRPYWITLKRLEIVPNSIFLLVSVIFCTLFVVVRNFPV